MSGLYHPSYTRWVNEYEGIMSRTRRRDPGGCWMRSPRHKRARVQAAAVADPELGGIVRGVVKQPPDAWDDLLVSYWRGQKWAREVMARTYAGPVMAYRPVPFDWNA